MRHGFAARVSDPYAGRLAVHDIEEGLGLLEQSLDRSDLIPLLGRLLVSS